MAAFGRTVRREGVRDNDAGQPRAADPEGGR